MALARTHGAQRAVRITDDQRRAIVAASLSCTVVRHTLHRDSRETIVTDYYGTDGYRTRITETFAI